MKNVYPVFIKQHDNWFLAYVPDLDRMTQGESFYDAIYMARDLIGTFSLDYDLPDPSSDEAAVSIAKEKADDEEFTFSDGRMVYIDIDTEAYRKKMDTRAVKKNCTIPAWLNDKAEEAGINFSRVLQEALISKLG